MHQRHFRMALEMEIDGWRCFRKALDDRGREAFDELMDMCRSFASPSGNATNPVVFEPMVMSILLAQHGKMRELEYNLNEVLWQKTCAQDSSPPLIDKPEIKSKP